MINAFENEVLVAGKTNTFSAYRKLLKVSLEYFPKNIHPFQGCLVVGMQHMLGTTVDMFRVMKRLGLQHAVVGSKLYSDSQICIKAFKKLAYTHVGCQEPTGYGLYNESIVKDIHEIWRNALHIIKNNSIKSIIVLDDGADLLLNIPNEIYRLCRSDGHFLAGIEQTKGGSNRTFFQGLPLPIINVAGSEIKNRFEYQWVAKEIIRILSNGSLDDIASQLGRKPRIGIIGYGVMGLAIANELGSREFQISVYDPKINSVPGNSAVTHLSNAVVLVSGVDVIIGCTGTDVTANQAVFDALHYSLNPKWLLSASSKDLEFNYLLHKCQEQIRQRYCTPDVLQTVVYRNYYGSAISLLRGGFPINFQNTIHSVTPEKIWPTRAGLLLASLMALKYQETLTRGNGKSTVYQLDPWAQMLIYHHYAKIHPEDPQLKNLRACSDYELCRYFFNCSQGEPLHQYGGVNDAFDLTLSQMPSHAYIKDQNGIYLACNHQFIQASGFGSRREIIGKTDRELWPSSYSRLQFTDNQVLKQQKQITLIEKVETKEGIGNYLSTKMPFYSDSKLIGIIGNSIPITNSCLQ